jgi:hypothetical protein
LVENSEFSKDILRVIFSPFKKKYCLIEFYFVKEKINIKQKRIYIERELKLYDIYMKMMKNNEKLTFIDRETYKNRRHNQID